MNLYIPLLVRLYLTMMAIDFHGGLLPRLVWPQDD